MHKLWATGTELRKRGAHHDHRCQRCTQLHETWDHIFRCPTISTQYNAALTKLTDIHSTNTKQPLSSPKFYSTTCISGTHPAYLPFLFTNTPRTHSYSSSAPRPQIKTLSDGTTSYVGASPPPGTARTPTTIVFAASPTTAPPNT